MKQEQIQNSSRTNPESKLTRPVTRIASFGLVAFLICLTALFAAAQQNQQSGQQVSPQPGGTNSSQDPGPGRAWSTSTLQVPMPSNGDQDFSAANIERRKQIADDSAKLLKLATELKTEVDKTTKDTLSLSVIRKADEIERLAHEIKEKMKLSAGTH